MSKRAIACPKCKKQYQVGPEMAGKKMKCPACQAVFVLSTPSTPTMQTSQTATVAAAATTNPGPALQDYQRFGLDGPLYGEADLFPSHPVTVAPLDNYAVDPGFGAVDPSRFIEDPFDPRKDSQLHVNPALSHADQLAMDIRSDKIENQMEEKRRSMSAGGASLGGVAGFILILIILNVLSYIFEWGYIFY